MDPLLALPSHRVYRGSLFAILFGSVVAISLLILPPASADQDSPPSAIGDLVQTATPTPTTAATGTPEDPEGTPPPEGTEDPEGSPEPNGTGTPEPGDTATPEPTSTPEPEEVTYTVQPGDTLNGIASQFAPDGVSTAEMADRISAANGITNPNSLQLGQELIIPQ